MVSRRRGHIDRLDAERGEPIQSADNGRAASKIPGCLIGEGFGVPSHRVARPNELKVLPTRAMELCKPVQMTVPHATTANNCESNFLHCFASPEVVIQDFDLTIIGKL
jgi:hypothetical protein